MEGVRQSSPPTGLPVVSPDLLSALRGAIRAPEGVRHRASDRLAMANDASHYLLTPQAVVVPHGADEVARLLRASAAQGVSLTFRSGGTSLSGQGVTDGSWRTPGGTSGTCRCSTRVSGCGCNRGRPAGR